MEISEKILSNQYIVYVNGTEIPVYKCRKSAYPFNAYWPGHQRVIGQSEEIAFVNVVGEGKTDFEITTELKYKKAFVKPYAKNVVVRQEAGKIKFCIEKDGQYVLHLDDDHKILYIFKSKEIPCDEEKKPTYYFQKGVHDVGLIELHSGESVYVEKDAYCYGAIFVKNAKGVRIYGNGIFNGEKIERPSDGNCLVCGNLCAKNSEDIKVEGVGFTDSCSWCVSLFNCENVVLDGIKVFGQWKYNTDGVDIVNSRRVIVKNSFVHSFDDTIAVKAYDESLPVQDVKYYGNCVDITVENCVLWCDWGNCLELGFETACLEYKNIRYNDVFIIHSTHAALSVHNGDYAEIHDIFYKNIYVEFNSFDLPGELQANDDATYTKQNEVNVPCLMKINNNRFRKAYQASEDYPQERIGQLEKVSYNHDIYAENVFVSCDEEIPKKENKNDINILIRHEVEGVPFERIQIKNLEINGKKVAQDDIFISAPNGKEIDIL